MKISPEILSLVPYKPGKPISETKREFGLNHVIKLASNENALGPSPLAQKAISQMTPELHLYPDASNYDLIQAISKKWGIPSEQIGIGNGSNEIIDLLIRIYCEPHVEGILTSEAAFVAYAVCAQAARVQTHKVPLRADFGFDIKKITDYFLKKPDKISLIFIANPNNPTGVVSHKEEIRELLEKVGNRDDVLIVFDEAYHEFVRTEAYESAIHYLKKYNNVIVLRTFSKIYGLAGIRLGVMVAPKEVVEVFNRVRNPFNINTLAQAAGIASLQDKKFVETSQQLVWKGLDYFYHELEDLGLPFVKSEGNFVFFDTKKDAMTVYNEMLKRGVILRPVVNYGFKTHLRMSVGLEQENKVAIKMLKEVL